MIYFDSSALVKRVIRESESDALELWLQGKVAVQGVSSSLARVEVVRATALRSSHAVTRARAVLQELSFVQLTYGVLDSAADLPQSLRSLDAIHLASALRLRGALETFVAYDHRLLLAAKEVGLPTASPGAP